MPRRHTLAIVAVLVLSLAGCSNNATAPNGTTISITGLSTLTIGQTAQLAATEDPVTGNPTDVSKQATWSSADSTIASVSTTGLLTAVSAGTTTVSASFQGVTGSLSVTVNVTQKTGTETYTYTGNAFTAFGAGASCPSICQITGSFTVANPIPASAINDAPRVESFMFTDGHTVITQANATFAQFTVSTDANGQIAQPWVIEVQAQTAAGPITLWSVNESATNAGDNSIVDNGGPNARNTFAPGGWTMVP